MTSSFDAPLDVSVIVPVRNEAAAIEGLLEALSAQTHPAGEILIVDAGSTDGTPERVKGFRSNNDRIKLVELSQAYPGVARNAGAERTQSEWLAFVDAGMLIKKNWLEGLVRTGGESGADIVYAYVQPLQNSCFQRAYYIAYSTPRIDGGRILPPHGACLLLRRKVWSETGGYPPFRASEDRQFLMKLRGAGHWKEAHAVSTRVYWEPPASLGASFRKSLLYGYHDLLAGRYKDWHLPVLRIYVIMFLLSLSAAAFTPEWPLLPLLLTAARTSKRWFQKRREIPLNPVLLPFVLLHSTVILLSSDAACLLSGARYLAMHKLLRFPSPYRRREG